VTNIQYAQFLSQIQPSESDLEKWVDLGLSRLPVLLIFPNRQILRIAPDEERRLARLLDPN
jgi:hypothetical protein